MPIRVWATGRIAAPGYAESPMCADARVFVREGRAWGGRGNGQSGWDWGINFTDVGDLTNRLRSNPVPEHARREIHGTTLPPGCIERLAIQAHGNVGVFFINGQDQPGLSLDSFPSFRAGLVELGTFLATDADVLLTGCTVASGDRGTRLLELLSGPECWPGRTVVGFTRTELENDLFRPIDHCRNPGVRLSDYTETTLEGAGRPHAIDSYPWADSNVISAKVARNGAVVSNYVGRGVGDLDGVANDEAQNLRRDPVDGGSLPPFRPIQVRPPQRRVYVQGIGWAYAPARTPRRTRQPGPIR